MLRKYRKPSRAENRLRDALSSRQRDGSLRDLSGVSRIDFMSNDYLGLARSTALSERVASLRQATADRPRHGSTGSRLISGNHSLAEQIEARLAEFHRAGAALLFGSGFAANCGLFSCLAGEGDTLVMDELIHASSVDGARLSRATRLIFRHNDLNDLERCLREARGSVFIGVESLYSMDGDFAPLPDLAELASRYGAALIVDEAHSSGILGPDGAGRVVELGLEDAVFARLHTFGKALGVHGAAIVGPAELREYLINFSRPFVFSTAPPEDSLDGVVAAYDMLPILDAERAALQERVAYLRSLVHESSFRWLDSESWIQGVMVPGNEAAMDTAAFLQQSGFDVRAIRAPSVAPGSERIRVCLHAFNSNSEIDGLFAALEGSRCAAAS